MPTLISEYRRSYYVDVDENETNLDVLMRMDPTEFKGPKDPRLERVIAYMQWAQASGEAKRSQIAAIEANEMMEVVRVSKPKAFRRA